MSQHVLRKFFSIISSIFFQGSDTHSASLDASTFLILPEAAKGTFSDHNQGTHWVRIACFPAGLPL